MAIAVLRLLLETWKELWLENIRICYHELLGFGRCWFGGRADSPSQDGLDWGPARGEEPPLPVAASLHILQFASFAFCILSTPAPPSQDGLDWSPGRGEVPPPAPGPASPLLRLPPLKLHSWSPARGPWGYTQGTFGYLDTNLILGPRNWFLFILAFIWLHTSWAHTPELISNKMSYNEGLAGLRDYLRHFLTFKVLIASFLSAT